MEKYRRQPVKDPCRLLLAWVWFVRFRGGNVVLAADVCCDNSQKPFVANMTVQTSEVTCTLQST